MGTKPRVDRSPEEKWQVSHGAMKSGNASETCRKTGVSPSLLYRWRGEAEQGAKGSAWEKKRCRRRNRRATDEHMLLAQGGSRARERVTQIQEEHVDLSVWWIQCSPRVARYVGVLTHEVESSVRRVFP